MQSLKYLIFVLLVNMQGIACKGQNFTYESVPSEYIPQYNKQYVAEVEQIKKIAVDLTNYLPTGYVTDGSVNYTSEMQKGINANKILLMPDFPIMTSGIHLINGTTLIFQKNSLLKMIPSSKEVYAIIGIDQVHDVNVYFAKIKGDRSEHIGTKGEWGFGIGINSSKNVRILEPNISNCWGDGIYINNMGRSLNKTMPDSNNIFIDGAWIDNNRRNGISVINGNNIKISNSVISNTNGTLPMSGIDIEPNNGLGELKNINIENVTTFNNSKFGILISLAFFVNRSQKNIKLTIKNSTDDGSNYGMGFVFDWPQKNDSINAKGIIDVINPIWKNGRSGEVKFPLYSSTNNVILKFDNAKVFKNGQTEAFPFQPIYLNKTKNIIVE